jgi:hypothetical protein
VKPATPIALVRTAVEAGAGQRAVTARTQTSKGYRFKTFDEMFDEAVVKNWLFKGVLARGETSAWIAPPGGMKSALMAELSVYSAADLDWHGKKKKGGPVGVVYFALERADLVERRIKAHCRRLGLKSVPIVVVAATFGLIKPDAVMKVIATIGEAAAALGVDIGLIIFDTFAKLIAAGGGDENQAKDQGAVFTNLQRVKDATGGPHIALVGHTGKDVQKGARGSNAILGDADVMVGINGDIVRTATVTKANDIPDGPLFSFTSEVHDFGPDEDGDPITVNIVSSDDVALLAPSKRESKLSPNQRVMFGLLHNAGPRGLSVEEWNDQARELDIGKTRKATLWELRGALKDKGLVREYAGRWTVAHE